MTRSLGRYLLGALMLGLFCTTAAEGRDQPFEKAAPWDRVRFVEQGVDVRVARVWHSLVSIDGIRSDDVLAYCKRRYGDRWQKRFAEDLVEVMAGMDKRPGAAVDLVLLDADGNMVVKKAVPMTLENRQAVRAGEPAAAPDRVARKHATKPDPRFVALTRRVPVPGKAFEQMLTPQQAQEDLDQLESHLTNEHSYVALRAVDYRAALDTIRVKVGAGISKGDFALQVHRVICLFGDGHARVRGLSREILGRAQHGLPFEPYGDRVVLASREPRDDAQPYEVVGIDGVAIAEWLAAVDDIVPQGAPHYRRLRRIRDLRYVPYLRARLGLPQTTHVEVQLRSLDGRRNARTRAWVDESRPYEPPPIHWEREAGVGYLRIREMTSGRADLARIDVAMEALKETRGLVIDVRGNGGGSRAVLRTLFPYFMQPDELHVANVAAFRIPPGTPRRAKDGYLANRFLYPAASAQWSAGERKHITAFLDSFKADMTLPADQFSAWHVMLLTRATNPKAYRYAQRVVVLMDERCFSATDVFLGALKGWRGVTLMGTPSGGGSGRSQRHALANSGVRFRLSSMASFRPTGERYDGRGITPDVVIASKAEDLGSESDSVRARALATAGKPIR